MEGLKAAANLVRALHDRHYDLSALRTDHLNILFDRSSVKAAESLLSLLERGTLTWAEEERYCLLEAAGVAEDVEDGIAFEQELYIIQELERSIERLQSFQFPAVDIVPPITQLNDGNGSVSVDDKIGSNLDFNLAHSCIQKITQNIDRIVNAILDVERRKLPGYLYETMQDWQVFTLMTVEEIETLWSLYVKGNVESDNALIRNMRYGYLNKLTALLLERLQMTEKVLYLINYCDSYMTNAVYSNAQLFKELETVIQHTLVKKDGLEFDCHDGTCTSTIDCMKVEVMPPVPKINMHVNQLPMYRLKSSLHRAQEDTLQVARLIKNMHDSAK